MFYMAERCGAWQHDGDEGEGRLSFRLFFPAGFDPEIEAVGVIGDFQHLLGGEDWSRDDALTMSRDDSRPKGVYFECLTPGRLPSGFYQYKYAVRFTDGSVRLLADPCARYGGADKGNAAVVVGGSRPAENMVRPLAGGRLPLADLVIYELHLDDFTDEYRGSRAPLDAVADRLDSLADLGFNAILFMPWTAWRRPGFDWGYEPYLYFAVEYRYANDLDRPAEKISLLKRLVSACHDRGIHVIMDGVFNHVSEKFPYKWLYRDPAVCPYTGEFGGSFSGLQDLDFHHDCTQEFVRDACLYWIETFGIDGIRFDNTVNFHVSGERKGLTRLLEDIREHLRLSGAVNFSLTLEHLALDAAAVTRSTEADSYWDNALHERCFGALWDGFADSRLPNALNNRRWLSSAGKVPTAYLGNHDHSHPGWQAGARENEGSMRWWRIQPWVILLYAGTGVPLVQAGQEFGEDHWIPESDQGTGRRVVPRPLRWKCVGDAVGEPLLALHRRMGRIRREHPALRHGRFEPEPWEEWQTRFDPRGLGMDTERQVLVFRRRGADGRGGEEVLVVVANFSDASQLVRVQFPEDGEWVDLLSGYDGSWRPRISDGVLDLEVGSHWGHVFWKRMG